MTPPNRGEVGVEIQLVRLIFRIASATSDGERWYMAADWRDV